LHAAHEHKQQRLFLEEHQGYHLELIQREAGQRERADLFKQEQAREQEQQCCFLEEQQQHHLKQIQRRKEQHTHANRVHQNTQEQQQLN